MTSMSDITGEKTYSYKELHELDKSRLDALIRNNALLADPISFVLWTRNLAAAAEASITKQGKISQNILDQYAATCDELSKQIYHRPIVTDTQRFWGTAVEKFGNVVTCAGVFAVIPGKYLPMFFDGDAQTLLDVSHGIFIGGIIATVAGCGLVYFGEKMKNENLDIAKIIDSYSIEIKLNYFQDAMREVLDRNSIQREQVIGSPHKVPTRQSPTP